MALSVTVAGTASFSATPSTSIATPAYNQAAGNCMYVCVNAFLATAFSISDTAGNTFVASVPYYTGGNSNGIIVYTVTNCKGNASNVVTVTFTPITVSYATLTYYDIGGAATASAVDVAQAAATKAGPTTTISSTITTTVANEAIITTVFCDGVSLTADTPPTGYTGGAILSSYSVTARNIVSAIQTGVVVGWTGLTNGGNSLDMVIVSFEAAGAVSVLRELMLLGVGT